MPLMDSQIFMWGWVCCPPGAREDVLRSFWSGCAAWSSGTWLWLDLYLLNDISYHFIFQNLSGTNGTCSFNYVIKRRKNQKGLLKNDQRELKKRKKKKRRRKNPTKNTSVTVVYPGWILFSPNAFGLVRIFSKLTINISKLLQISVDGLWYGKAIADVWFGLGTIITVC